MADQLDLPKDEFELIAKNLKNYESSSLRNDNHIFIEGGKAKVNEVFLEAECDTHRFYVDTPEKGEVYNNLKKFAETVNVVAERYNAHIFVNATIPLLEADIKRKMDNITPVYKNAAYRPEW